MYQKIDISFVIACYNSEKTIEKVIQEIAETVKKEQAYEIICVNDFSKDSVLDKLYDLRKDFQYLKIVNLAKNFGQHNALMAGFSLAQGNVVVVLDDDGQSPICEVYKLLEKINNGADVVISTTKDKKHGNLKLIGSKINEVMSHALIGTPKKMNFVPLYAFKQFICQEIIKYKGSYPYIIGLLYRTSTRIEYVEVIHRARGIGKTNYTLNKLISLWLNGFTAFSVKPLRVATLIGMLTAFAGFIYGIVIVFMKFFGHNYMLIGWSSLMAVLLFIGGMTMIFLGLIGEYIGRIYLNMNSMPQYVIREKTGFDD